MPMSKQTLYKVIFMNQGKIYEVFARSVGHGSLFGFVEVEELVFGERSTVVVDPSEEKIKSEFKGVKCTYLPMHTIVRIDEVDKQGPAGWTKYTDAEIDTRLKRIDPNRENKALPYAAYIGIGIWGRQVVGQNQNWTTARAATPREWLAQIMFTSLKEGRAPRLMNTFRHLTLSGRRQRGF